MEILVIDLESTCWEPPEPGKISEIIEIGYATIDMRRLVIARAGTLLIKPVLAEVSAFCTQLNGHTQENLNKHGLSVGQAFSAMRSAGFHKLPWASWGNYDRNMIEKARLSYMFESEASAEEHGKDFLPRPVSAKHLNVKTLFAWSRGLEKEVGMDVALKMLGMKLEGRHHNGRDDAHNIARILCVLLRAIRGV